MRESYEVAIIGGGPAGSLTAVNLCLARPEMAGEILLLESKEMPREKVCGGGVAGRVVDHLASLGISLEGIPTARVEGMFLVFGERKADAVFHGRDCRVVRRSAFDALLLERARELGARVRTGTPVAGAFRERGGMVVVDSEGRRYHARALVCADGVNGASRTWLGMPARNERRLLLQTDLRRVESGDPLDSALVMDYSAVKHGIEGYVWVFPSVDEEGEPVFNCGITGLPYRRGATAALKAAFEDVLRSYPLVHGLTPGPFKYKSYPERVFSPLQPNAGRRVIFVGDQLGVDHMTGEGLGICCDSARCAAEEILGAMESGDYSFRGYNLRLARSGFFPLFAAGKVFVRFLSERRFPLLLSLIANDDGRGGDFVLDHYCKIFAGISEPRSLYSVQLLRELARGLKQL